MAGKLLIIGFGPGDEAHITKRAREAISESEVIIGYNTYVDLIRSLIDGKQVVRTGMTEEVSRAQEAVRQAEAGRKVAVISSGDAGVYGMAGLVYEVLIEKGWKPSDGVEVEIVPGISAINSCASLLGAPVMHDACTISLSDHLTPWDLIRRRVEAAASADFVIALYNPRSGRRTRQIVETQQILLKHRSPDTPVGIVKSAYRDREHVVLTTLAEMLEHDIGMLTTVIIGNSATRNYEGLMITPRGYQRKYTLDSDIQPLRPHERLRREAEPWALEQEAETGAETEAVLPGQPGQPGAALRSAEQREAGSAGLPSFFDEDEYGDDGYGEYSPEAEGTGTADDYDREDSPVRIQAAGTRSAYDTPASSGAVEYGVSAVAVAVRPPAAPAASVEAPAPTAYELAEEALRLVTGEPGGTAPSASPSGFFRQQAILEFAVSPGLANKNLTAKQLMVLAAAVGDTGTMEYTPHHQLLVKLRTDDPDSVTKRLRGEGLLLAPVGDVVQIKACDFCNMDKGDAVPYAEELHDLLGGAAVPKEMKIGFNGCGMACYGAVKEDIGIVYRREKFDLFLGGKTVGRNAHAAQPVAEGIEPDKLVETIERIVARYRNEGHPNERFHKFFARVKELEGYRHREVPAFQIENALCGD
ncbi:MULTISPECIES: precorrin-3B C(17)-methyltransferase [unclassified Paenibacillus]|uniref:precorrin-3B C(17)-methyltransferase n=1 Tax=unclassified Paenibacillus TaxID=185978 RepID=UPI00020D7EEE|nr:MULTISPECIES: precorrin-3B C(17)-methyltransferase [unclassified Paenibacillus]EGL18467.1 precorrin-3B C(17)-methyltransferase [Paenibacillus sp. HGF7]EPD89712.1 precorrin-3B C17-methyltransferase [Paenibacillus sp. HGH0039]